MNARLSLVVVSVAATSFQSPGDTADLARYKSQPEQPGEFTRRAQSWGGVYATQGDHLLRGDRRGRHAGPQPGGAGNARAIAASSIDAAKAGAAIVHIHVRDPNTGKPSMDTAHYREAVERIRASGTDVLINLTTGPGARFHHDPHDASKLGPESVLRSPEERVQHVMEIKPDICSLDMGSLNMGDRVFVNTPAHLQKMALSIKEAGVMPELKLSRPAISCSPNVSSKTVTSSHPACSRSALAFRGASRRRPRR